MLRRILSAVMIVAMLAVLPALTGCEKNEVEIHRQTETTTETTEYVVD